MPQKIGGSISGPFCIYVELTWLQPHLHCIFAVLSQMEKVQLTSSFAQNGKS
jgi:hypothetical protein